MSSNSETTENNFDISVRVWRQKSSDVPGGIKTYAVKNVSPNMSFLEMLDVLNEELIKTGEDPVAFDHDCREGICGTCSLVIDGQAHGPDKGATTCQLHMRRFRDGDTITVEPFRASAFPVIKDLVVDRSSFDRVMQAGGYISVKTGSAPEANAIPVPKNNADLAMDAAACMGCGARRLRSGCPWGSNAY